MFCLSPSFSFPVIFLSQFGHKNTDFCFLFFFPSLSVSVSPFHLSIFLTYSNFSHSLLTFNSDPPSLSLSLSFVSFSRPSLSFLFYSHLLTHSLTFVHFVLRFNFPSLSSVSFSHVSLCSISLLLSLTHFCLLSSLLRSFLVFHLALSPVSLSL